MPDLPYSISLTKCRDGSRQEAQIVALTRDLAETAAATEGDYRWDWVDHVGSLKSKFYAYSIAIRTPNRDIQAAMTYRVNGRSLLDPGQKSVFGEWLATAPWN